MSSSGAVEYKRREAWQDDRQRSNHSGSALADRGGFQSESTDPTRTHMHARAHTHTPHTRAHTRTHTHHTRAHTSHTRARTHTAGSVDSAQTDGPDDAAESAIWEEQYPARKGRDGAQPATRPPCPLPAYYPSRKLLSPCCYSLSVAGPYFSIPSPVSVSSPDSVPLPISSPSPDPDSRAVHTAPPQLLQARPRRRLHRASRGAPACACVRGGSTAFVDAELLASRVRIFSWSRVCPAQLDGLSKPPPHRYRGPLFRVGGLCAGRAPHR